MQAPTIDARELEVEVALGRDPGAIPWNYTRTETIADLMVHVVGLCFGFTAAAVLLAHAALHAASMRVIGASIYSLGLLSVLTFSAAYNLWPVCPVKWWLRRLDQSAIYVLIAATYTPFVVDANAGTTAIYVLIGVWCVAALGVAAALALPGRVDRVSIGLYIAMGWSVVIFWSAKDVPIPFAAFRLLVAGGVIVTVGLIFHVWKLRFQNAIWHLFVLAGITCQYAAVLNAVLGQATS